MYKSCYYVGHILILSILFHSIPLFYFTKNEPLEIN